MCLFISHVRFLKLINIEKLSHLLLVTIPHLLFARFLVFYFLFFIFPLPDHPLKIILRAGTTYHSALSSPEAIISPSCSRDKKSAPF